MKHWHAVIDLLRDRRHEKCVEVGVWKGDFTVRLLNALPDIKSYWCIDPWAEYSGASRSQRGNFSSAYVKCQKRLEAWHHKASILRMTSREASKLFKPNSLDFGFIDADHRYEFAKEDIELWLPKVKDGGILAGHDYLKRSDRGYVFGVIEAVDELLPTAQIIPGVFGSR